MKLSIRYKILGVLGALLLAAVSFYTLLASSIFVQEKTALLYDINHSIAYNASAQIRSSLLQVADQLRLFAITELVSNKFSPENRLRLPPRILEQAFIQKASLFQASGSTFLPKELPSNVPRLTLPMDTLKPYLEKAVRNQYAFWKPSDSSSFLLASRLEVTQGSNRKPEVFIVVGLLGAQLLYEPVQTATLFESFLIDSKGESLLQVDRTEIETPTNLKGHPLLQQFSRSVASSGTQEFEFEGRRYIGAFAPVGIADLWFVSQADHGEVQSALTTLVQRSILFGLIVATLTFIASILFSKRLTRPLKTLAERAEQIGAGNWGGTIELKSGDEVETLANSFNTMVQALKSSRDAIEKYNRELEDKVEQRTEELRQTNATIKEVQEKLLSSTQLAAAGEVAGRTAHELLNPLTAILSRLERSMLVVQPATASQANGQLENILSAWESEYKQGGIEKLGQALQARSTVKEGSTLLEEDLANIRELSTFWKQQTDVISQDLGFVQEQAQRIHRIIDRMREYTRASEKADVLCHQAIQSALSTLEDFLSKHQVKLTRVFNAPRDLAYLNADELIQILTNLVRNAFQSIQSSPRRDMGRIEVETRESDANLLVQITDNGAGVPPEKIGKLFQAGFTTKGPSEGTGMGLSICRRYARAFGGDVELLYSEPEGRGTCFLVTIPLKT